MFAGSPNAGWYLFTAKCINIPDRKKLKEFITTKPILQKKKMLKGLLKKKKKEKIENKNKKILQRKKFSLTKGNIIKVED